MEQDTEQIILKTARKHFIQKGFTGTRMQEIANDAGINKALLHYYFRSKEKLYQEILHHTFGLIIPKLAGVLSSEGTFWERTEKLVDTYIQTIIENPHIPIFVMFELSQQKESFIQELKKHASFFPSLQSYLLEMIKEMNNGKIVTMQPAHLLLNILGMTVFPFMAKPIFSLLFNVSDKEFYKMMNERRTVIINFLKNAMQISHEA